MSQQGGRAQLTWSYPALTTRGTGLTDLTRIEILAAADPLPQAGATPRVLTEAEFRARATKVGELLPRDLGAATAGSALVFDDPIAEELAKPTAITYALQTKRDGGETSDLSNLVVLAPLPVPRAPTGLAARPSADGVRLTWKAPAANIDGTTPANILGYNIYRRDATSAGYGSALNAQPVTAAEYLDAAPTGGRFAYSVRALRAAAPRLEGEPADEIDVTHADVYAPPVPQNLAALAQPGAVRLVWDSVTAADLAGYVVYRQGAGGQWQKIAGPLGSPTYLDESATRGRTLRYAIAARDTAGNESARSVAAEETVP